MIKAQQIFCGAATFALLVCAAGAQTRSLSAGRISIAGENPLRLHIQTSAPVAPQVQLVSGPERLVIDLPNTVPGIGFHGISAQRGEIRGVRAGVFSTSPLLTRVVVDLKAPQWYQVAPDSSGLMITLGNDPSNASNNPGDQATIGWVSTKSSAKSFSGKAASLVSKPARSQALEVVNGVSVQFTGGLLSIHAQDASLSEVLFQIQKKTGAEIAIPAGTEQERVAADFGPGTPNEVLAELLNGSGLNFVVIGSEADPNTLRSVILSRKGADADPPTRFAQSFTPPPAAENIEPENPQPAAEPAPLPQQQQIPENGPPPEPPQN